MKEEFKKHLVNLIISASTAALSGAITTALGLVNWLWILLIFISVFVFLYVYQIYEKELTSLDKGRRKGIVVLTLSIIVLIIVALGDNIIGPAFSQYLISDASVNTLICGHHWVTYEPQSYDPANFPNPVKDQISAELTWIKSAGFEGIITFTSRDTFSIIPELAKKNGLFVIMGIWNPKDSYEVARAIAKREFTDAYSVGHNGLNNPISGNSVSYSYNDLVNAMQYVRYRTQKPVSTTELLKNYYDKPSLLMIGDWVFPDAHMFVTEDSVNSVFTAEAITQTIKMAKQISAQKERGGKPVLLKMVTYPIAGVSGVSPAEQTKFFVSLLNNKRDSLSDMPSDVCISVHSAFDTTWKKDYPFYKWDSHTGLLDNTGIPRPAVKEIIKRQP